MMAYHCGVEGERLALHWWCARFFVTPEAVQRRLSSQLEKNILLQSCHDPSTPLFFTPLAG
jgi:hypothetical protein